MRVRIPPPCQRQSVVEWLDDVKRNGNKPDPKRVLRMPLNNQE